MQYLELAPSPHLTRYVKCFWSLEDSTPDTLQNSPNPVIPDGCTEIIFNLCDRFRRHHADGKIEVQPATIMVGQMRGCAMIEPSNHVKLFGIRFYPAGAYHFFRFALADLTDKIESLDSILGTTGRILEEQINEAETTEKRINIAERFLNKFFAANDEFDVLFENVSRIIVASGGTKSMKDVAKISGVSSRRLERKFQQNIGVTPKFFSRLVRFKKVLELLKKQGSERLLDAAFDLGYYDQAHLIHEFKQFSGRTPTAFFREEYEFAENFISYE